MPLEASHRIDHYPTELIDVWRCRQGVRYTLRPVLPQDRGPLGELVRRLSRQSRYRRFHGAVNALPDETLRGLTHIDYREQMALVVTTAGKDDEHIVSDVRYCVGGDGDAAEFAIVVDDACQRRGLGLRAMRALDQAAARRGVRWLHGSVLASNAPMLAMMRRCGFSCMADRDDDGLVRVERRVGPDGSGRDATRLPLLSALSRYAKASFPGSPS
jgi:GNAT superfamily N-acetyltransferase